MGGLPIGNYVISDRASDLTEEQWWAGVFGWLTRLGEWASG
jgi:hypothetical protein